MSAMTPAQITALINAQIIQNGVGAITGPILNNILLQIVNLLALAFTLPESITVTAENTLDDLSNTPSSPNMALIVNGQTFFSNQPNAAFSFSGIALTWNATNAGFVLETTDKVVAHYSY